MVSIRGPKSALSDFIEENNINTQVIPMPSDFESTTDTIKQKERKKRYKKSNKNIELLNIEKSVPSLQEISVKQILVNITLYKLKDSQLKLISEYLSKERMMNEYYFSYLVNNCEKELYVHDCSMISGENYVINKNLDVLELHFCGQLGEISLNHLLSGMISLKKLVLTGAFLINNIVLPNSLEYIDLMDCSRLKDNFIDSLNANFTKLNMLRLSKCFGLTENCMLKIPVDSLFICETNLGLNFFENMPNFNKIMELSIKRCPNLFTPDNENVLDLLKLENVEIIDIEGMSTISQLDIGISLKKLNVSFCFNFEIVSILKNTQLEYLNLSRVNPNADSLKLLINFKELKILILSWSEALTDEIIEYILIHLNKLEEIHVFGCFNLTEKIGEMAWAKKGKIKIIGNPSETRYLLNN